MLSFAFAFNMISEPFENKDDGNTKRPNPSYALTSNDSPGIVIIHVVLKDQIMKNRQKGFVSP